MKTIKQIADELGVSKQTVQKRLSREPLKSLVALSKDKKGTNLIDVHGENAIKQAFGKFAGIDVHSDMGIDKKANVYSEMVDILKQQVEDLKADKAALQSELAAERQYSREQIATLTSALVSEQALHAGTIQKQLGTIEPPAVEAEAPADDIEAEKTDPAMLPVEPVSKIENVGIFGKLFGKKKGNK